MNPNSPSQSNHRIELPDPERRRHTPRRFSWIDHRLLRDDHLAACACPRALALYLVLVAASDARGLSYYSERRLSELLSLSREELVRARRRLVDTGLIAWRRPHYQVLSLDPDDIRQSRLRNRSLQERDPERSNQTMSIGDVLRQMAGQASEPKTGKTAPGAEASSSTSTRGPAEPGD
jgi:hypothetical protein